MFSRLVLARVGYTVGSASFVLADLTPGVCRGEAGQSPCGLTPGRVGERGDGRVHLVTDKVDVVPCGVQGCVGEYVGDHLDPVPRANQGRGRAVP